MHLTRCHLHLTLSVGHNAVLDRFGERSVLHTLMSDDREKLVRLSTS